MLSFYEGCFAQIESTYRSHLRKMLTWLAFVPSEGSVESVDVQSGMLPVTVVLRKERA